MTALDTAIAAINAQAPKTIAAIVNDGAAHMVAEPRRIVRLLYPFAPDRWPTEKSPVEILADCRTMIRGELQLARECAWAYSQPKHVALLQAEEALVRLARAAS